MREQEFLKILNDFPSLGMNGDTSVTFLQALIENNPIALILLDAQHRFTMCNPAFERLFQYSPSELADTDLDELIAGPERVAEAVQISDRVLRGNKVHKITQRRRRDGMIVDVELYGIPLIVEGELAGVYGLYQDVTEQNKAQIAVRQISDRMEDLQQEERRRIARDVQDSTAQELAALNWNLARLRNLVSEGDETLKLLVQSTIDIASQCSTRIRSSSYLLRPTLAGTLSPKSQSKAALLTERERQVMQLLAKGMTSREAAMQLNISPRTVESHRVNISRKLSFGSIADLVRYAIRNGIVSHA